MNDLTSGNTEHWHGIASRNDMDGVHDLTQAMVEPSARFTYRFTVPDAGTYWFHPHMGLELDRGLYARPSSSTTRTTRCSPMWT